MSEDTEINTPSFADMFQAKITWIKQVLCCYSCSLNSYCGCDTEDDTESCGYCRLSHMCGWLEQFCYINRVDDLKQIQSLRFAMQNVYEMEDCEGAPRGKTLELILHIVTNLESAAKEQLTKSGNELCKDYL